MYNFECRGVFPAFFLMLGINSYCSADSLWTQQNEMNLTPVAAVFNIVTGGQTSVESTRTDYAVYSDTACMTSLHGDSISGSYMFMAPSVVQVNGTSFYNIVVTAVGSTIAQEVRSIQIAPVNATPNHIFQDPDACFQVSYSGGAYTCTSGCPAYTILYSNQPGIRTSA